MGSSIHEKYKSALVISGLVTFIAAYHYIRIFNSWTESYAFPNDGGNPRLTGKPFNDAYRYMDWLLTVPLLLLEIIFCMSLTPEETSFEAWSLGVASALMIAVGYPGELIVEGDLTLRFMCFFFSFMGVGGAKAVVGIQLGYCASDVISKCGVGFLI